MASIEQVTIQQSSPQDVPSETTPLVKTNHKKQSKKSLLIKSKAIAMILFWTALMSLVYGFVLNSEVYFLSLNILNKHNILQGWIPSCIYAFFAVWLLFYPLAGYLADVRYGRYKVVKCSVFTAWCGFLIVLIIMALVCAILLPVILLIPWNNDDPTGDNLLIFVGVVTILMMFCLLLCWLIAFAGFLANVIQFGVDQLIDSPAKDSFLFIHWFLFTANLGMNFGKLPWSVSVNNEFISLAVFGPVIVLILLICLPTSLCVAKRRWFIVDTGTVNPYKDVARVVGFARRNKIPIQRSAFTFWEDDIPTGLDLGKQKYGGPFTTEQVENVKSFFGIVLILLSLGPFFTVDIAAAPFLSILQNHMEIINHQSVIPNSVASVFYSMFLTGGALYPLFVVIFVPIFLKLIHPLLEKYFPGSLKRIGVGLCLITLTLFCSMIMDTVGHFLPGGHNSSSIFSPVQYNYTYNPIDPFDPFYKQIIDNSLHMSPSLLIIQQVLIAVAYVFIYGGVFELICAQSPHSMKGFLIGILYAIKGLFQLIGVPVILLPFSFWQSSPRAGLVYFVVNIVISVFGVVVFTVAAKRYKYRQRDELYNERKYIEEVFEKDVNHNVNFEDLEIHFDNDSDSEI